MTFPIIAATLGGALIVLQQILMLSAGAHRGKLGIGAGVNGDQDLERKVRRHGNLAENAAIFIVVLAIAELYGAPAAVILTFASVFGAARVCHAIGFMSLSGSHGPVEGKRLFLVLRAVGAFGTVLSGAGLGGYLLYLIYFTGS